VRVSKSGSTLVDVRAPVTGDLLDRLKEIGAVVEHASRRVNSVRASIPLDALTDVAGWKDVASVDVAAKATSHQVLVSEGDKAHAADLARTRRRVTGTHRSTSARSVPARPSCRGRGPGHCPALPRVPGPTALRGGARSRRLD
jgi:hypothetical protein